MTFQALYVHIPFCLSKCNYCDFVSYAGLAAEEKLKYLQNLRQEMQLWQDRDFAAIRTIYVGGGTPTVLPVRQLAAFIKDLCYRCPQVEEVTVECNPGTVSEDDLRCLLDAGVTRLSIGVESFVDEQLAAMGRIHNADAALAVLQRARMAGFLQLSIDLMYGLPGQSVAQWLRVLHQACNLDIDHLSVYGLTVSSHTPWGRLLAAGSLSLPEEDLTAEMMLQGMELLDKAGFEHYEIANFARPGCRCRHNLTYWRREDYLALGVAAAGLCGNKRWVNERELTFYRQALAVGERPVAEEELLTAKQVTSEAIFLGLRLLDGIDLKQFSQTYNVDIEKQFAEPLQKLLAQGLLKTEQGHLHLTEQGILLANEVFVNFI